MPMARVLRQINTLLPLMARRRRHGLSSPAQIADSLRYLIFHLVISESWHEQNEWNRYKVTCQADGVTIPTKQKLVTKIADINGLVHRSWTEEELQNKLNRSGALANKYLPIERKRLTNLLKEAVASEDLERAEEIRAELAALDGPKLAFGTSLKPSPKKQSGPRELTQQEKLAQLNREIRKKNIEDVRRAQINERRKLLEMEAAIARGETVVEDHSRRHKTRAKFKHDVNDIGKKIGDSDRSGTNTPGGSTPSLAANKKVAPLPHIAKLQEQAKASRGGIPSFRKVLTDDDIIGAIDLDIDIDIGI
jgi:RNA polymerase-associated protein RTF1